MIYEEKIIKETSDHRYTKRTWVFSEGQGDIIESVFYIAGLKVDWTSTEHIGDSWKYEMGSPGPRKFCCHFPLLIGSIIFKSDYIINHSKQILDRADKNGERVWVDRGFSVRAVGDGKYCYLPDLLEPNGVVKKDEVYTFSGNRRLSYGDI